MIALLRRAAVSVLFLMLLIVMAPAMACGYHGNAAVGALNFAYPNALWVRSAVWQAQMEGLLDRPRTPSATHPVAVQLALAHRYREVTGQFEQLRMHLAARHADRPVPSFSVLLMGPMMWSRFESSGASLDLQVHAPGPVAGDVVLLTDEPVLRALASGRMRLTRALELGVVRIHGPADAAEAVTVAIGTWSPAPPPRTRAKSTTA